MHHHGLSFAIAAAGAGTARVVLSCLDLIIAASCFVNIKPVPRDPSHVSLLVAAFPAGAAG